VRLTTAQAIVRFLVAQRTVLDGVDAPLFAGVFAIFGHGNVLGLGNALEESREVLHRLRARPLLEFLEQAESESRAASGASARRTAASSVGAPVAPRVETKTA